MCCARWRATSRCSCSTSTSRRSSSVATRTRWRRLTPTTLTAHGIHVVRRLSGGGAVYHDLGNLNFSFVTNGKEHLNDFARFTGPVVAALRSLGVPAELRGRSDILVEGRKISGNAQYATPQRMFSHGTLLFDTDLGEMLRAIEPAARCRSSRRPSTRCVAPWPTSASYCRAR
ncbi:MAG: lipoate--protein ligase family protein [Candidatus Nanopelagicales bacterium]